MVLQLLTGLVELLGVLAELSLGDVGNFVEAGEGAGPNVTGHDQNDEEVVQAGEFRRAIINAASETTTNPRPMSR